MDRKHNYRISSLALGFLAMGLALAPSGCGGSKKEKSLGWMPVIPNGPSAGKVTEVPMGSFVTNWKLDLPLAEGSYIVKLSLDDDRLYAFASNGQVYWIHRDGGVVTAFSELPETGLMFEPLFSSNRVIFPTENSLKIYTTEGKFDYQITMEYGIGSLVSADSNRAYVNINHPKEGRIQAIDLRKDSRDLGPLWELITNQVTAKVAYYDNGVYIGARDGKVYAVSGEKREILWGSLPGFVFDAGSPVVADLAVDSDGVYVATQDSKLTCLDPSTGKAKWRYYSGMTLQKDSTPVPVGAYVYIKVPGKGLAAIEKKDINEIRQPKWLLKDGSKVLAIDETCIYVAMEDHTIVGVERATGEVKFRGQRADFAAFASNVGSKTVSDKVAGDIYAATSDGKIYCVSPVYQPGKVGEWVMGETTDRPMLANDGK